MIVLFGCKSNAHDIPIDEFLTMSAKVQAKYLNGLSFKDKISYFEKLNEAGGYDTEYGEIKFLKNGEFIYDYLVEPSGMAGGNPGDAEFRYFVGYWKVEKNNIILWKTKYKDEINLINDREVWHSYEAEAFDDNDLFLKFEVVEPIEPGLFKSKSLRFITSFGSEAIQSYMEIVQ